MADNKVMLEALYAKQDIRLLEQELASFRECLRLESNPRRREWLGTRIIELTNALHTRTGMWY